MGKAKEHLGPNLYYSNGILPTAMGFLWLFPCFQATKMNRSPSNPWNRMLTGTLFAEEFYSVRIQGFSSALRCSCCPVDLADPSAADILRLPYRPSASRPYHTTGMRPENGNREAGVFSYKNNLSSYSIWKFYFMRILSLQRPGPLTQAAFWPAGYHTGQRGKKRASLLPKKAVLILRQMLRYVPSLTSGMLPSLSFMSASIRASGASLSNFSSPTSPMV